MESWLDDWYVEVNNGESVRKATSVDDLRSKDRWRFREKVSSPRGDAEVSTVFLGLDHGGPSEGLLLYETMIFGGQEDGQQWRYATRADAMIGHEAAKDLIRAQNERRTGTDRRKPQ